jgi:hypothetical protein
LLSEALDQMNLVCWEQSRDYSPPRRFYIFVRKLWKASKVKNLQQESLVQQFDSDR